MNLHRGSVTEDDVAGLLPVSMQQTATARTFLQNVDFVLKAKTEMLGGIVKKFAASMVIWLLSTPDFITTNEDGSPRWPFSTPTERLAFINAMMRKYVILMPAFLYKVSPGLDLQWVYGMDSKATPEEIILRNNMKKEMRVRICQWLQATFQGLLKVNTSLRKDAAASLQYSKWLRAQLPACSNNQDTGTVDLDDWVVRLDVPKIAKQGPWCHFQIDADLPSSPSLLGTHSPQHPLSDM
ncbi:uncharacterized protein LY89DRAFT_371793 [Mollisia scopiformis]|uniref:Uncharacterized protein n=1 Tax=Mollisia scopiformis TaxID=149040 RepID=A0A132B4F2_MOLSC|nr:uncharacterized protein LY89DRAFT_371793 [Mollisia scopiformis]KUJ07221.1 hypothetical protein LY89DRAFT_371793 [Mollisia scopiformis]